MKFFCLFTLLTLSALAQEEVGVFDQYLKAVNEGLVTKSNSIQYMKNVEAKVFLGMSELFDDLQVSMDGVDYIAPKDKVSEFSRKWSEHFKEKNVEGILKKLSQDPNLAFENPLIAKTLKNNRKFCQILREKFYIFDKSHLAPKSLEKVVKPFGKLNDAIVSKNPELVEMYSKKVLKGYKKLNLKMIVKNFRYINKNEFNLFFKVIKKDVKKMLLKNSHSIHDFHWIRKQHKKFLVIYFNLDGASVGGKFSLLDNYITKLGDLNDIYVDMKMRLGSNLDAHQIVIDDSIKKNMNKTIKFLEADMKTVQFGPSCSSFFSLK